MPATTSLERLLQLRAEIASLEQSAIQELMERRNALSRELATVDAEIAKLTGNPIEKKKTRSSSPTSTPKNLPLQELKELLAAAPNKTLNIRKENLELRNIKVLATANPPPAQARRQRCLAHRDPAEIGIPAGPPTDQPSPRLSASAVPSRPVLRRQRIHEIVFLVVQHQHRARRPAHHVLGRAALDQMRHAGVTMRRGDDQIRADLHRDFEDPLQHRVLPD